MTDIGVIRVGEPQERRGLPRLMLRFPFARNALASRYVLDSEFRSLCAAYEDAHEGLKSREQASIAVTHEVSDYRQLVLDMESDIIDMLPAGACRRIKHADEGRIMTLVALAHQKLHEFFRR